MASVGWRTIVPCGGLRTDVRCSWRMRLIAIRSGNAGRCPVRCRSASSVWRFRSRWPIQTLVIGVSIDKALAQLRFFWELKLSKSQADSLLSRLAREWHVEFDRLC